jgi:hypothetical protein
MWKSTLVIAQRGGRNPNTARWAHAMKDLNEKFPLGNTPETSPNMTAETQIYQNEQN